MTRFFSNDRFGLNTNRSLYRKNKIEFVYRKFVKQYYENINEYIINHKNNEPIDEDFFLEQFEAAQNEFSREIKEWYYSWWDFWVRIFRDKSFLYRQATSDAELTRLWRQHKMMYCLKQKTAEVRGWANIISWLRHCVTQKNLVKDRFYSSFLKRWIMNSNVRICEGTVVVCRIVCWVCHIENGKRYNIIYCKMLLRTLWIIRIVLFISIYRRVMQNLSFPFVVACFLWCFWLYSAHFF